MSPTLEDSATTWSDHSADPPVVDPRLVPPVGAGWSERLSAWRLRHHLRQAEAERVTQVRAGRTTVVCTVSPLWLHHADRVVLLDGDRVVADGRHEDLLDDPAYRSVVARAIDEEVAR